MRPQQIARRLHSPATHEPLLAAPAAAAEIALLQSMFGSACVTAALNGDWQEGLGPILMLEVAMTLAEVPREHRIVHGSQERLREAARFSLEQMTLDGHAGPAGATPSPDVEASVPLWAAAFEDSPGGGLEALGELTAPAPTHEGAVDSQDEAPTLLLQRRMRLGRVAMQVLRHAYDALPQDLELRIGAMLHGGSPLAPEQVARFESALSHPLDHVRVHTDAAAAKLASQLNARAFAVGAHVFFGRGQFSPGSPHGDQLLAHELTHVVQHDEGRLSAAGGVSSPSDPTEQEAYANERRVVSALRQIDVGPQPDMPSLEGLDSTTQDHPADAHSNVQQPGPTNDNSQSNNNVNEETVQRTPTEAEWNTIWNHVERAGGHVEIVRDGTVILFLARKWLLEVMRGQLILNHKDHPAAVESILQGIFNAAGETLTDELLEFNAPRFWVKLERLPENMTARGAYGPLPTSETGGMYIPHLNAPPQQAAARSDEDELTLPPSQNERQSGEDPVSQETPRPNLPTQNTDEHSEGPQDQASSPDEMIPSVDGEQAPGQELSAEDRARVARIREQLRRLSPPDRALYEQLRTSESTDLEAIEAALQRFIEDPREVAIQWFRSKVAAEAIRRLDRNAQELNTALGRFPAQSTADNRERYARLRVLIEKDRLLYEREESLDTAISDERFDYTMLVTETQSPIAEMIGIPPSDNEAWIEASYARLHELEERYNEIKELRSTLHQAYPETIAFDPEIRYAGANDAHLQATITRRFEEIQANVDDIKERILSGDIKTHKLGAVVDDVLASEGLTAEARAAGDQLSTFVLGWLDIQDRQEQVIAWTGTLLSVSFTIGAALASGGLAVLLGVGGAGVGLGTAAHELEIADDVYDAANVDPTGANPLVRDPEEARFNYIMAWVNLALAGVDIGLTARGASAMFRALRLTRGLGGAQGAELLSRLSPEQITRFDELLRLRRAGNVQEAEALTERLRGELGPELFDEADGLLGQADALGNLLPESAALTPALRQALSPLDAPLLRSLGSLPEADVIEVARTVERLQTTPNGAALLRPVGLNVNGVRALGDLSEETLARLAQVAPGDRGLLSRALGAGLDPAQLGRLLERFPDRWDLWHFLAPLHGRPPEMVGQMLEQMRRADALRPTLPRQGAQNCASAHVRLEVGNIGDDLIANSGERVPGTVGIEGPRRFTILEGHERSQYDSEVKIFETIAERLDPERVATEENPNMAADGDIVLFTDRPPCPSCQSVINRFNDMFPKMNITVSYDPTRFLPNGDAP